MIIYPLAAHFSVPYVMPAKNSVFMARVFIDHRRDELHMGENHEKVTFLP